MKIAVEGCAHGELDHIYETIKCLEENEKFKVDLLICCGDFQSTRNESDLHCMAIPTKYHSMCSFYKYYNGEKLAPILTIFIGGNHEASNYLQELPYGGWVAPNIYYMGYAGVINVAGVRIGGISGIYKGQDYMKGHFESIPYNENTKRSVYHIRNLEVFRLKQLSQPIDICISHDWPSGVWDYGNKNQLIRFKPHFRDDIETGKLGSQPCGELLNELKPAYWFAGHLHCKFAAFIPHDCGKVTKFLALDKCLPKRRFLQVVDIPHNPDSKIEISYDLEWLAILKLTNDLLSVKSVFNFLPGPGGQERWCFKPTDEEKEMILANFHNNLVVPDNFVETCHSFHSGQEMDRYARQPSKPIINPQTVLFCKILAIDEPLEKLGVQLQQSEHIQSVSEDIKVPVIEKRALVLPEPANTFTEFNAEHIDSVNMPDCRNLTVETSAKVDNTSVSELFFIDTNRELSKPEGVLNDTGENALPVIGKFKRRNASLYQNDEG